MTAIKSHNDEIMSNNYKPSTIPKPAKLPPRWKTLTTYISAATIAVLMALTCPQTKLWNRGFDSEAQSTATLNQECLFELIVVFVLTMMSLLLVQGSDPGYLDSELLFRLSEEDGLGLLGDGVDRGELELTSQSESDDNHSPLTSESSTRDEDVKFYRQRRKLCDRCQFHPPLRAHHCKVCDKCVATFDHHCTFIGTCIGERNHCRFWWFLTFQLLGFAKCVSIVHSSSSGLTDATRSIGGAMVLVSKLYLYPLTLLACVMWIAHTWFAVSNMTSFECGKGPTHIDYLKGTEQCDLPFSNGMDANLRTFCCLRDTAWTMFGGRRTWSPVLWKHPGKIVRDSEDWWNHPWQNKYYSCC